MFHPRQHHDQNARFGLNPFRSHLYLKMPVQPINEVEKGMDMGFDVLSRALAALNYAVYRDVVMHKNLPGSEKASHQPAEGIRISYVAREDNVGQAGELALRSCLPHRHAGSRLS